MRKIFDVVIERDKETKQFYASVPALPGCYSYAENISDLLEDIKEAISLHLAGFYGKRSPPVEKACR